MAGPPDWRSLVMLTRIIRRDWNDEQVPEANDFKQGCSDSTICLEGRNRRSAGELCPSHVASA